MTDAPATNELLALADEYERGTAKAVASGYEEYGPDFQRKRKMIVDALRAAAEPRGGWRSIENAPCDERILVYNELWDYTHGAVQIAVLNSQDGSWLFDSDLSIDDIEPDDIETSEEDPLTPADFRPQMWQPLRAAATPSAQGAEVSVEELEREIEANITFDINGKQAWANGRQASRALLGKYRMEKR